MHRNLETELSDHSYVQVIAPFLIILRVANRRALTSDIITSGTGSIHFRGQTGSTDDDLTLTDGDHNRPVETTSGTPSELGTEVEDVIEGIAL